MHHFTGSRRFSMRAILRRRAVICAALSVGAVCLARAETPPLGMNTYKINDYGRVHEFVDAMKHARTFGSAGEPWKENATRDGKGWPTGDAGVVVLLQNADQDVSGTYKLSFTGTATVAPTCCAGNGNDWHIENQVYNSGTNTTTADLVVLPGNGPNYISFTHTNGGVRNVKLIRPGYDPANPPTFTTPFLNAIAPFSVLRLMDFLSTNDRSPDHTVEYTWDQRRPKDWATQATTDSIVRPMRGVSWEYAAELANVTGKDIWINIPVAASNNYMTGLARLLDSLVNDSIVIYVEYSNELWNYGGGFDQFHYNQDAAEAEVAAGGSNLNYDGETNVWYWGKRRAAKRTVECSDIFRGVFGDAAMNARVRFVLPYQVGGIWQNYMLRYVADNYGPPSRYLYATAQAPYMGNSTLTATVDQCLQGMRTYADSTNRLANMRLSAVAAYWGVKCLAYEGGPGIGGSGDDSVKIAANYDPRIKDLIIHDIQDNWYAQGGDLYMYYSLCSQWSGDGLWGTTQVIEDLTTPKYKALTELLAAQKPAITAGTPLPAVGQTYTAPVSEELWGVTTNTTYYVDPGQEMWFLFRSNGNAVGEVRTMFTPGSYSGTLTPQIRVNGTLIGSVSPEGTSSQSTPLSVPFTPGLNVVNVRSNIAHMFRGIAVRTTSATMVHPEQRAATPRTRLSLSRIGEATYRVSLPEGGAVRMTVASLGGRTVKKLVANGGECVFSMRAASGGIYTLTADSKEGKVILRVMR
jgi:hypothetical protein